MLTSMTGHDSVLLRADDPLIDMNYITSFTGMTDKWFYKLISEGHFPKPIKLGRSSRWYKSEVEHPAFCSAGGGPLAASAGISLHTPFGRRKYQRATDSCILYFLLPTGARTYY